jgi:hypothetical protein
MSGEVFGLRKEVLRIAAVTALCGSLLIVPAAQAAVIWEQGPNYHLIQYCEDNPAGSVVLRIETAVNGQSSDGFQVNNSIHKVLPGAGWDYQVKKAGGLNGAVEVQFTNGKQTSSFKSRYVPGKTVVDCR